MVVYLPLLAVVAAGEGFVVFAGVAAGIEEAVAALAATYVLITALDGIVVTRWLDPEAA